MDPTDIPPPPETPLTPEPASPAPTGASASAWLTESWRIFRLDPWLWVGMAVLYSLIAILCRRIPFMGQLLLVLLTPLPLAGALATAREQARGATAAPPVPVGGPARFDHFVLRPLRALMRGLRAEGAGFALALICIVTLGLFMVVVIAEYLLAGGSVISGISGQRLGGGVLSLGQRIGMGLSLALYALLIMTLFHLLPLTLWRRRPVFEAAIESLRGMQRHAKAFALFGLAFLLPYALIASIFIFGSGWTRWLGYLMVFSAGSLLTPLLVIGNYLSFRTLYGDDAD